MDLNTSRSAAWLLNGDEQYGVAGPALVLARRMRELGWKSNFFLLREGTFADECRRAGFDTECFDAIAPRLDRNSKVWNLPGYWLKHRQFEKKVVARLANSLRATGARHLGVRWPRHIEVAGKAAKLADIPCYWLMPNRVSSRWPFKLDRWWYRRLCRTLRLIPLPNSEYTGQTLGRDLARNVLYLGIDEGQFDPNAVQPIARSELGLPNDACVIGVFARLEPDKGQEQLLEAVIQLSEQGADVHLLVVGGPLDSPFAARLRELANRIGASQRLHLVGWTAEPQRYYSAIDFSANARISPEPFGLSVVESMFMRKPVLVHALGGPAETVIDGVTGWHVPEATSTAFAAGIRRALADRGRWLEMGEAARQHALQNFTAGQFVTNYLRIVEANTAARPSS